MANPIVKTFLIYKTCNVCKEEKHRSYFEIKGHTKRSFHVCGTRRTLSTCRSCVNKLSLERYHRPEVKKHQEALRVKRRGPKKQYLLSKGVPTFPSNREIPYDHCPLFKVCKVCGVEKFYKDFSFYGRSNTTVQGTKTLKPYCKKCRPTYLKNIFEKLPKEEQKRRLDANKVRRKREYELKLKKPIEERRKYSRDWAKKDRDSLGDAYIKHVLAYKSPLIKRENISQELIDLKRSEILLNRAIKERKENERRNIERNNQSCS